VELLFDGEPSTAGQRRRKNSAPTLLVRRTPYSRENTRSCGNTIFGGPSGHELRHYCGAVDAFSLPIVPRYAEVDQQGVVFNGHYLTWFDEACTGFLDHLGVTYPDLIATGHDVQVVHSEIDYLAPVRWRDSVRVAAQCERIGSTSFTLAFTVLRHNADTEEREAVRGRNVYVVVSTDDWAKRPIPEALRNALTG
jgi:acyl-CoA thioester hydrolase